ncbi:MAG: hypothetical protein HYY37_06200 [Candidatus Aenigmarchaeota archaeon]|nr:hypothetical protein [Candidatus Aenigmarchaeota archaeon]
MSSVAEHKRRIKEHVDGLQDAVNIGIENKPATVGFHTSACAAELLELYLHLANLISSGKRVNHTWFKRPQKHQKIVPLIERKMPVNFPNKEKVYELLYTLEENRDNLVYGKSTKSQIEVTFSAFQRLKGMLQKMLEERGEKIE